ncbi:MAG TPA: hypothetical protein DC057_02420 [Spirochaetia bacterium]|nr:hypothetical protein [Spirochaetia bacterium]
MEQNLRFAATYRDDMWITIQFMELKKGDLFYLFEPDGTRVYDENSNLVFRAETDAYYNNNNIGAIQYTIPRHELKLISQSAWSNE